MTDDLVVKLRDEDSYYRLQEKHWCIDAEELERQRLAAADRIAAIEAENERLREAGTALYVAGRWSCDQSVDEAALWTAMRDALGLPVGTETARAALGEKP